MNSIHLIMAVAAIFIAAAALVYLKRREGFENPIDGVVPAAAQTSSIPKDVGGATTSNPQVALAAPKDVQAASDALQTFKLLVAQKDPASTDLDQNAIALIQGNRNMIPVLENKLKAAYANPDVAGATLAQVTQVRQTMTDLTKMLAGAQVTKGPTMTVPAQNSPHAMPHPTLVAKPTTQISLSELTNLRYRINKESLKLANLRSTSPTMIARRNQLESLAGELTDIITRLKAGKLAIKDVPITKADAVNFLKHLSGTGPLPALHLPAGTTTSKHKAHPVNNQVHEMLPGLQNPQLQKILQNAQNLKWGLQMNVSYDPKLAADERLVHRLAKIENRLTQLATSGKRLPDSVGNAFIKELEVLRQIAKNHKPEGKCVDRFPTNYSAIETYRGPTKRATHDVLRRAVKKPAAKKPAAKKPAAANKKPAKKPTLEGYDNYFEEGYESLDNQFNKTLPDVPSQAELSLAQGAGFGTKRRTFPNGELSPDIYVRPGVLMTDETISHRASAGSFDGSVVGGPDWKKRSLDLCKQVQSASLGDPANFGCIKNPTEVGPDYSWKGNYTMVCNRIGDTWGGWYPAMLGCPAYDPTAKFRSST
jgi:hypothetical protein